MKFLASAILALFLAGCGQKEGTIEIKSDSTEANQVEMLEQDSANDESALQKAFLKKFDKDRVHFSLASSDLSDADKVFLKNVAEYLIANADLRIEIQGNCDKRGSKEYNIALGLRRADAVLEFLKSCNVPEHRMAAISFGSRILVPGDNELEYEQNRVGIILIK